MFPRLRAEDTGWIWPETASNECPRAPIRSGSGLAGEVTSGPPKGSLWSPSPGGPSAPRPLFLAAGVGWEGVTLMMLTSSSSSPSSSCCRSALMGALPIIPGSQSDVSSSGTGVCNVKYNFEEGASSTKLANSKLSHTVLCNYKEYPPRFPGCRAGGRAPPGPWLVPPPAPPAVLPRGFGEGPPLAGPPGPVIMYPNEGPEK